jgi:hypothetical protein
MQKTIIAALASLVALGAQADPSRKEVICSLAPSQNAVVNRVSGAAGGAGLTTIALAQATGLTAVAHSSGAYILTGSAGYVAGTLGGALVGPAIVGVGLVVGGAAVTVELICAPMNHPTQVAKIYEAGEAFARISHAALNDVTSRSAKTIAEAKRTASDFVEYAYLTGYDTKAYWSW